MRSLLVGGLIAATALLCGCDSPIVGEWESDKKLDNGKRNKMTILSDGTGDSKIWATPANNVNGWVEFKFDITWEDFDTEFELDMDCDSAPDGLSCSDNDFRMDCEVIEDDNDDGFEKADCKGNKNWKQYPFDWQRNE